MSDDVVVTPLEQVPALIQSLYDRIDMLEEQVKQQRDEWGVMDGLKREYQDMAEHMHPVVEAAISWNRARRPGHVVTDGSRSAAIAIANVALWQAVDTYCAALADKEGV